MQTNRPSVSVIIPAREAADTLPRTLESIASQTYPNIVEVIVAAADAATANAAGSVTVVDNPRGTTPAGLNHALSVASGDVIVRCDAHALLPPGYVERAVETLLRTNADSVGGMQVPIGSTTWEKAIAAAMSSPMGAGDARYRIGGVEGPVETVYLGAFPRATLDRFDGYDEAFLRSQDYELNHRIVSAGGVVWFDPELRVVYSPRGSVADLARQYFRYGRAKRQLAKAHRGSLRLRQFAPPLAVVGLFASLLMVMASPWWLTVPAGYLTSLLVAGVLTRATPLRVALALGTMHMSWGLGFITG